jgi:serine/threonine protein kinase
MSALVEKIHSPSIITSLPEKSYNEIIKLISGSKKIGPCHVLDTAEEKFTFKQTILDSGYFGAVYDCNEKPCKYVLKIVSIEDLASFAHECFCALKASVINCSPKVYACFICEKDAIPSGYIIMEKMKCTLQNLKDEFYRYLDPTLTILETLFDNGIIHLDISPNNLMFNDKLEPKFIDFGLCLYSPSIEFRQTIEWQILLEKSRDAVYYLYNERTPYRNDFIGKLARKVSFDFIEEFTTPPEMLEALEKDQIVYDYTWLKKVSIFSGTLDDLQKSELGRAPEFEIWKSYL